jgi:hypothetical protein
LSVSASPLPTLSVPWIATPSTAETRLQLARLTRGVSLDRVSVAMRPLKRPKFVPWATNVAPPESEIQIVSKGDGFQTPPWALPRPSIVHDPVGFSRLAAGAGAEPSSAHAAAAASGSAFASGRTTPTRVPRAARAIGRRLSPDMAFPFAPGW